jgi:hypothetical protein
VDWLVLRVGGQNLWVRRRLNTTDSCKRRRSAAHRRYRPQINFGLTRIKAALKT